MGGSPFGVVANMLDCNIIVSEFKLQSNYYIHFRTLRKGMKPLITPAMDGRVPLQFFYKDGFAIK